MTQPTANLFIAVGALAVFALAFSAITAIVFDRRARRRRRRRAREFTAELEQAGFDWNWPPRTNGHEAERETA